MLWGWGAARRGMSLAAAGLLSVAPLSSADAETITYQYDALGRLVASTNTAGPTIAYEYDKAGNRTRVSGQVNASSAVSISANAVSQNEGNSGSTSFVFSVARSGPLSAPLSVAWSVAGTGANPANAADFVGSTLPSGSLSFIAAEAGPKTIVVLVSGDTTVEPNEEFTVTLSNVTGGAIGVGSASQIIMNDDTAIPVVANSDAATTTGNAVTLDPRLNDSGGSLTITGVTQPTAGGVASYTSNSVTFTPAAGFNGVTSFSYTVSNGVSSATGTITITVGAAPLAVADSVSTTYGAHVSWDATANDTGTRPFMFSTAGSTHTSPPYVGIVLDMGGGVVRFEPQTGFFGTVRIPYTIQNSYGVSSSYADVTVAPPNPTAITDNISTPYQTSVTFDPRSNDLGVAPLTITAVGSPSNGTRTFTANSVTYTPNTGYTGIETFTYTVSNAHGSTSGAIVVNVGSAPPVQAPVAANDQIWAVKELLIPELGPWWGYGCVDALANDSGTNKTLLSVAPAQTASGGLPSIENGQVCYSIFDAMPTTDTFTYTMSGDGGTSSATVTVHIP